jgi:hypothetical protein
VVEVKIAHFVFRFIASAFAIGASLICAIIVGSWFSRERTGAVVVEIRRAMKRGDRR